MPALRKLPATAPAPAESLVTATGKDVRALGF
jgi:hypothetical protein